ncbi:MAG TPA: histidine kinase [Terriglobales bacterium]|nr:histidine kinase [Terriglobales bacterium]
MSDAVFPQIGRSVARCRLVLSLVALMVVFIDPSEPLMSQWIPMRTGTFVIDSYALAILLAHLGYSIAVIVAFRRPPAVVARLETATTWADVAFGAAIAAFTEGINSPMYAFFVFAVTAAGLSSGLRRAIVVTSVSVALYLSLIVVSAPGITRFYVMRPAYLGVIGYLVGYLGQQRLKLEAGIRELAATNERQQIARDLHDGRAQALAGINLRLETCRELLRRGSAAEALSELSDLQTNINREYDELRAYMRSLVGLDASPKMLARQSQTRFRLDISFEGSAELVENVIQIAREGVTNVTRHAAAQSAEIHARREGNRVLVTIDDDGVGFRDELLQPWTISSLAIELGGTVTVRRDRPGAHLAVSIPAS